MLKKASGTRPAFKLPRTVYIVICVFPAVLALLFYVLRSNTGLMSWFAVRISSPVRGVLGLFSTIYPLSLMEILCAAAAVWLIYYIVRTVMATVRRRDKLKILSKRLLTIAVAALYVWSAYCWLWNVGYFAHSFAANNGFSPGGVTTAELTAVTRLFAEKANEFAPLVKRDAEGHCIEDRREFFAASTSIYDNMFSEFPGLGGRLYRPKSMLFSWLMSRTGYTGIYFALTGESNINTNTPAFSMPSVVAHELAHQRGVYREDEANFVGIAACVTSGNPVYEYSGWLSGLMYLCGALSQADREAWVGVVLSLSEEVNTDWQDNHDFWQSQKMFDTGVKIVDKVLTATTGTVSEAVDTVYDSFLRSHNQELGLRSYGACVDLLVQYFSMNDGQWTIDNGQ